MRVGDLAQPAPVTVTTASTVVEAAQRMRRFHVGDLVVTDGAGLRQEPIGILTDRDIVIGIVGPAAGELATLTVSDVLSVSPLVTVHEDADAEAAAELLSHHGIRRLPVVNDAGKVVGIITLDDLHAHFGAQLLKLTHVAVIQREAERRARA